MNRKRAAVFYAEAVGFDMVALAGDLASALRRKDEALERAAERLRRELGKHESRSRREVLFQLGDFRLHSGAASRWKIECDALTPADWDALALMASEILPPFGSVEGVPRGGLPFAAALEPYATDGPVLIADDVCTTGASMEAQRAGRSALGIVAFARGPVPDWVTPVLVVRADQEATDGE